MALNEQRLVRTLRTLRIFIDHSLGLDSNHRNVGFHYNKDLLEASAYNTYLETVGNKSDRLYSLTQSCQSEMMQFSYLEVIQLISNKFSLRSKEIVLAFDYTDEDFYGDVQGIEIHGWTKKDAVTGKFKFLTCSIVSDEIEQKIPIISVPILLGHNMAKEVSYCLSLIKELIGQIKLILFDRGFYSKELMHMLNLAKYPYLIFVPKDPMIKKELEEMQISDSKIQEYEYKYSKDKSTHKAITYLAFLKQVFCKKLEKELDWAFATNVGNIELETIISTYKKRWRIENGFRIQDEAIIKCKSKSMKTRFFLFLYEQLLVALWYSFFKEEVSFKRFLIELSKTCNVVVKKAEKKALKSKEQ